MSTWKSGLIAAGCMFIAISRADAGSLQLQLPGPAAVVYVSATGLNPSASGYVYAGVLNWGNPGSTTALYHTYCIDINHDISVNGQYSYTVDGALKAGIEHSTSTPQGLAITGHMVNAIYSLWDSYIGANNGATVLPAQLSIPSGFDSNQAAAAFQTAIWDVLYNEPPSSPTPLIVAGTTGSYGGTPGALGSTITTANNWANNAWNATGIALVPKNNFLDMFTAIDTTLGAQDQVYYFGTPTGASTTPLPMPVTGGLALMGLLAVRKIPIRNRDSSVSV